MITRDKIEIRSDIPLPPPAKRRKPKYRQRSFVYPVEKVAVGESFLIAARYHSAKHMAQRWQRELAKRGLNIFFKVREMEEDNKIVIRCWRVV